MNLRELAESDLSIMLEDSDNGFGLPVIITKKSTGETQTLNGQVLLDYSKFDDENGIEEVIKLPIVTLRISSLNVIPETGEVWYFDIPETPQPTATKKRYIFDGDLARRGSDSLGFYQYPLREYEDNRT
jgi:hypothetical protein